MTQQKVSTHKAFMKQTPDQLSIDYGFHRLQKCEEKFILFISYPDQDIFCDKSRNRSRWYL
jgi:hypothetical protein